MSKILDLFKSINLEVENAIERDAQDGGDKIRKAIIDGAEALRAAGIVAERIESWLYLAETRAAQAMEEKATMSKSTKPTGANDNNDRRDGKWEEPLAGRGENMDDKCPLGNLVDLDIEYDQTEQYEVGSSMPEDKTGQMTSGPGERVEIDRKLSAWGGCDKPCPECGGQVSTWHYKVYYEGGEVVWQTSYVCGEPLAEPTIEGCGWSTWGPDVPDN